MGCNDGPTVNVTVTVNPTPRIYPVPGDTIQCDSSRTRIVLRSPSRFTSGELTFRYTAVSSGGITGYTPSATGLPKDYAITDYLVNATDSPQHVLYTITPVSPAGCDDGRAITVRVIVNPTPRIFPVPGNSIQCDSTATNIQIQSPSTFTSGFVTFNLSATGPSGVKGYTTAANGLVNGFIISDNLINETDSPLTVTYRLIPINGLNCKNGPQISFTVTVNPTPRAVPINIRPAICYGGTTEITLLSPTVMTSGEIRFDYSVIVPTGVTGNSNPGSDKVPGDILGFNYRNYNDTVLSVNFLITPKVTGLACPAGNVSIQEVQVHPKPARGIQITKPFTCEASSGLAALRANISKGAGPYNLVWTGPVGYYMLDSLEISNLYAGYYTLNVIDNLGCMGDTAINIANLSANPRIIPLPKPTGYHITCPGGNDGIARIYVRDGGSPPFNYWLIYNDTDTLFSGIFMDNYYPSDTTTFRLCTGLKAGNYKFIIRDYNNCEIYRTAELLQPPPFAVTFNTSDFNGYNVTCRGYSDGFARANVSGGNGGYTYFWYPASGSLGVDNTSILLDSIPAGKYYLRITDMSGCIKIDSVTLVNPPGMVLADSQVSRSADGNFHISCNGASDGFINLTIAGGSGTYTYLWVGPNGFVSTSEDISNLKAGVYTCTVTDINGCILMPQPVFDLEEPAKLEISTVSSVSAYGNYNINCYGGAGSIDATITGGSTGNYTYNWSSSDGSGINNGLEDQNSLTAGLYHLRVTDLNGCVSETNVLLTEPDDLVTQLIPVHITCQSGTYDNGAINLNVTGGVEPYNFRWSNGESVQNISNLIEGYYSVTVTDANGCKKVDSVRVNLPPPLNFDKVLSTYNGYNISCYGRSDGSITLNHTSGMPPFNYTWQGPDGFISNNKDIKNLKAGEYILFLTDTNLCTGSDTIQMTEPGRLSLLVTSLNNVNCNGGKTGSIMVEAVNNAGPASYMWADGTLGSSRTGLTAGSYKVIITDLNNCQVDSLLTLTEPESLALSFEVKQPFCTDMPDGEIRLTVTGGSGAGYTYLWSDNSTEQNLTNAVSGFYNVRVTDMNGCVAEKSMMLVPVNSVCLNIPNAISPNGDLINDVWNIGLKELYPQMEVKIFNRWGELVWKSEKGYPIPWDGRSNGTMLPMDSYHYLIDLNNGSKPVIGHVTIVK